MKMFLTALGLLLLSTPAYAQSTFTNEQTKPATEYESEQEAQELPTPEIEEIPEPVPDEFDPSTLMVVDPADLTPVPQPTVAAEEKSEGLAATGLSTISDEDSEKLNQEIEKIREAGRAAAEAAKRSDELAAELEKRVKPTAAGLGASGYTNEQRAKASDSSTYTNEQRTPRDSSLEDRVGKLETRMGSVEKRVEEVERQLKALLRVQYNNGQEEDVEVEIDHISGYGDFAVPKGGKVIAINGRTVNRVSPASIPQAVVYTTGEYVAAPSPSPRTMRIMPMASPPMSQMYVSNARIVNQTGAPISWSASVPTSQYTAQAVPTQRSGGLLNRNRTVTRGGNCVNCN